MIEMKNNRVFDKFIELKKKFEENPTKAQREEVVNEVEKLIIDGWITESMKVIYDFGIEKYRTIGLNSLEYMVYDKDKSIRILLQQTYRSFLPKNPLMYISGKRLVFEPHKPITYNIDGVEYANLFLKNRLLSYNPKGKRITTVNWSRYKAITPLFENVFKTLERMNYFVNWLAFGFQTLTKARTAIISKGIQGTGKGVIFEKIRQHAIGKNYTTILENEALKSRFNGELENKLFVLANEIKSDFREGNNTYEKLKMYVSDSEIRFEEKNIRARTIPNFFNIWFHSNNDVPLQIQGSDRRYTVFNTKSKKLTEVSNELGFEYITDFLTLIEEERDSFIHEIISLKYDMILATTPFHTQEKELIYEASMSKIEVLADKIKKSDIEYLKDGIEDFYDSNQVELLSLELNKMNINGLNSFIIELNGQLKGNYLKNDISKILYKIFVNENETDRKIGLVLNRFFGKSIQKWIEGKNFKYRKIENDKEVDFKIIDTIIRELSESGNLIIEEIEGEAKELF
jgi:hypothetical protein